MIFCSSCENTIDQLSRVGRAPVFLKLNIMKIGLIYQQILQMKIYLPLHCKYAAAKEQVNDQASRTTNSFWKAEARTFFRDQRAPLVKDILKVIVTI